MLGRDAQASGRRLGTIRKRHVAQLHRARDIFNRRRIGVVRQLVWRIEHFEHAPRRGDGALHHVVHARQRLDWAEQPPPVRAEGEQLAERERPAGEDRIPADADHEDVGEKPDRATEREEDAARVDRADLLVVVGFGRLAEALRLLALAAEDLDHDDAGEVLLQPRRDVPRPLARSFVNWCDLAIEHAKHEVNDDQRRERRQRHLPVQRHHQRPRHDPHRSEERRVGKECRSRWGPYHEKKKNSYKHAVERAGVPEYATMFTVALFRCPPTSTKELLYFTPELPSSTPYRAVDVFS